ncbi:MAG: hypothetical protein K5767_05975 [Clostridia bacterium]|nr:hypothetical protein [Clostridia bacterium]
MKKLGIAALIAVMVVGMAGCGNKVADNGSTSSSAAAEPAVSAEVEPGADKGAGAPADVKLAVPAVKDGVTRPGEDAMETYFEWDKIEGADGYEVSVQSKFYSDETFSEPEIIETTDSSYVASAQDYFDFLIKVRAYKGTGADRVYSDWSKEAAGFSYDESEVAK